MAFSLATFLKGLLIQDVSDRTKQFAIQVSPSATTNTTTTLIASQTANQTLTLPDSTDVLSTASSVETLTNKSIDATTNTLSNISNSSIAAAAGIAVNKLAAETANRALETDGSGFIAASAVTATELGYVSGVTSSIQTQLDSKLSPSGSLTDNHVLRADGTSGIQNSNAVIDDSGNLTGVSSLTVTGGGVSITSNTITANSSQDLTLNTASTGQNVVSTRPVLIESPASGTVGSLAIREDQANGTNIVRVQPVASLTADRVFTLPDASTTAVGTDATQTLSNKTFSDAITSAQISTPSNPSSGFDKLYFKSDNNLYSLTSAGLETQITSAGSAAPTQQIFTATGTTTGYYFVTSGVPIAHLGDTYTNNGQTFTVLRAASVGQLLFMSSTGAPTSSGTLTLSAGTGSASINFTSNVPIATYTTPANAKLLKITVVGGGGAGGGNASAASTASSGAGGAGGSMLIKYLTTPAATYYYAVGAGGAGSSALAGAKGVLSAFANSSLLLTGASGNGGAAGSTSSSAAFTAVGGSANTSTGGDISIVGGNGGPGIVLSASQATGGSGGASGGGWGPETIGPSNTSGTGNGGNVYGSGGSGSVQINNGGNQTGGGGNSGIIVVEEFYI